jgi:transposase
MGQRSGVEEAYAKYNQENGTFHRCLCLPKFHPELNYIEQIWARMKYYIRLLCDNHTFIAMCLNIVESRGTVNLPIAMIH